MMARHRRQPLGPDEPDQHRPDASPRSVSTTVTTYTGGTGRCRSVRGIQRESIVFDPVRNRNQVEAEAEYWFEE